MAQIPYDPTLVLGNLVEVSRINALMLQAKARQPQVRANDKLNALITSSYKMDMIYNQIISMGVSFLDMIELAKERAVLKDKMADAAVELGEAAIKAENEVFNLQMEFAQQTIGKHIESPLDYAKTKVAKFPLAFDSLKFDVQFFRMEKNEDSNSAHASKISRHVGASFQFLGSGVSASTQNSSNSMVMNSTSRHEIEGTIVITAACTHQYADIMSPCVLNPRKAVKAWNATFPDDTLLTDPGSMLEAAMAESRSDENKMHLLSGCTKGSSFVGYVHILQLETSESTQKMESMAKTVETVASLNVAIRAMSGSYGMSKNDSKSFKQMLSTSELENQCSFSVEGVIPTIECDKITTTVQHLKPDAKAVMGQLAALNGEKDASGGGGGSGMSGAVGEAKKGAQFTKLNNAYLENSVDAVGQYQNSQNSVININTMMNTFEDYLKKCMDASEDNPVGIPTNFYLKEINKSEVAKCYIQTFYPNGATGRQGIRGAIGMEPAEGGEGGTSGTN